MDASHAFASNVANTRFEDIPADAVKVAKNSYPGHVGMYLSREHVGFRLSRGGRAG